MSSLETLRPEHGSPLYWQTIGLASQEDQPLRDRQAAAAFRREHFRCGGCAGPATRLVGDPIEPTDCEPSVPLCDTCTVEDAASPQCDWSDEHKAARPVDPPEPFSFEIPRAFWLRGLDEWDLFGLPGEACALGHYLRAKHPGVGDDELAALDPEDGFDAVNEANEAEGLGDAEQERRVVAAFATMGVAAVFTGEYIVRYPNGHRLNPREAGRTRCGCCEFRAVFCESSGFSIPTRKPTRGISFYYYCASCWEKPGPSGTTPRERAESAVSR